MYNSLLESIISNKLEKSRKKNTRNLRVLLEPYKDDIWKAYITGCTKAEIYNEMIAQKKFYGTLKTFRIIFNNMFPGAEKIRKLKNIESINELTGLEENQIIKRLEALSNKKIIKKKDSKKNKDENSKKNIENKEKSNNSEKKKKKKNMIINGKKDELNNLENILDLTPEEKENRLAKIIGNTENLKNEVKEDKDNEVTCIINKLKKGEELWDAKNSTHGFPDGLNHIAGR